MRTTAVCDSPVALAIMRLLQCVASRGVSRSLFVSAPLSLRTTSSSISIRSAAGAGSRRLARLAQAAEHLLRLRS